MLTNLSLENIKSFNKEATLKIAPITLIYGPNSSGKSSLWKFFLALKNSLEPHQQNNFLNLARSDFATIKTLSFDRSKKSTFTLNFSARQDIENPTVFSFNFENPRPMDEISDLNSLKKMLEEKMEKKQKSENFSKEDMSDLVKGIEDLIIQQNNQDTIIRERLEKAIADQNEQSKILKRRSEELSKSIDRLRNQDDLLELSKNASQLREEQSELNGIRIGLEKKETKIENNKRENINNVKINELEVKNQNKTFMKFKVIELPIIKTTDQGIVGAAVVGAKIITRYRENNIINVLKKHYSEYFSNDKLLFEVKIDADKKLFFSDQDTPSNQKRVFDMVGPNGPKEIKISNSSKEIRYLFLPTKISKDKSFWQEYFDFLQFLKKKMLKNKKTGVIFAEPKTDQEIFESYLNEHFDQEYTYLQNTFGVDGDQIPEIKKTFNRAIKAMLGNIDTFIEVMSEDLETFMMSGSSFIPSERFYGARIFKILFDEITEKFLDSYIGNFDEKNNLNPLTKEGEEFVKEMLKLTPISIVDQIKNLYQFNEELISYKQSAFNSPFPMGTPGANYGLTRTLTSSIHEDYEYKKKITELLDKVDLPFEIKSKLDDNGNIILSFENKRISKLENYSKEIPLEQSGNALKSILFLLSDALRSKDSVIILEEPENKLHPKIQGNLIELLAGLAVEKNNKIIIETHSEHFILRIQKLIREKIIKSENIAINYVYLDEDGEGSKIDHMKLDENGKFIKKWRHGFFNERLNELS
jgi:predicted ATPase